MRLIAAAFLMLVPQAIGPANAQLRTEPQHSTSWDVADCLLAINYANAVKERENFANETASLFQCPRLFLTGEESEECVEWHERHIDLENAVYHAESQFERLVTVRCAP
ncbi:MAG: hypothetical protein Q4G36_08220 [Paracoccus sp. (in: a-proteobacteria)]|nr:hypothetical protein [Paracoccus sp. (in: a-proteobacteria)]